MEGVSPRFVVVVGSIVIGFVVLHVVHLFMNKLSNEKPLLAKIASLDKQLFKAKNEALIIKREMDQLRSEKSLLLKEQATVVDSGQPPTHLIKEMETIKAELATQQALAQEATKTKDQLALELSTTKDKLSVTQGELQEAESVCKELLEDKKKSQVGASQEIYKAVESLRDQLNNQRESVQKYEHKIKKREAELKEKIQEVRKLRADSANAKLQVEKISKDRDVLKKSLENFEQVDEDKSRQLDDLNAKLEILETAQKDLVLARDSLDTKDSEIEAMSTEIEALKETIQTLEVIIKSSKPKKASEPRNESDEEGWDAEDDIDISDGDETDAPDLDLIQETSRLKVDLKKAQSACEQLTVQLTEAETEASDAKDKLQAVDGELLMAREAKEQALKDKVDLEQKAPSVDPIL